MSKHSIDAKVDFILEMCLKIKKIVTRHDSIVKALNDYEGQMAILMGISQIGETLKKIDDNTVDKYNLKEDKEGAYYTRNYIVNEYKGVDLGYIESIVREYLPKLEEKILVIKNDLENINIK